MSDVNVEQLADRVQRLEDIEAIKRVIVRYAQGADKRNDPDIMVPLFAENGVWDGGDRFGVYQGHDALRNFFAETGSFINWTLHYMVSPAVDISVNSGKADAFWYLWETAVMPEQETEKDVACWIGGTYEAKLSRQSDAKWKFDRVLLNVQLLAPYEKGWAERQVQE